MAGVSGGSGVDCGASIRRVLGDVRGDLGGSRRGDEG
jgi:hypothetical protein